MKAGVFGGLCRLIQVAILAVAVAGCAGLAPRTAEQTVQERSQARWDALVKGDSKAAYAYFSPGSKAVLTEQDYASSIRQGFWKSAKVERVTCGGAENCEALVTIEYEYQGRRTKTPLRETWIREGSDWWFVQK